MNNLQKIATLIRYWSLASTTEAGSGHPTSSLSATDLMTVLFFDGFFRFDTKNPAYPNNDRLLFSKGHASPLFYALWAATGAFPAEELMTLRKLGSRLEGHPTFAFPFTEAPTGSLGQGLPIGLGMALNAKYLDKLPYKTYVLLGDSELAEGSNYEAFQLAAYYKLNNLIGILDVNRLGQSRPTMFQHDVGNYEKRIASFGWETIVIDGHNFSEIHKAFTKAQSVTDKPMMIIAKTIKGKGISFLEDKEGWHGKALKKEELAKAVAELEPIDKTIRGSLAKPEANIPQTASGIAISSPDLQYKKEDLVATRKAYGNALARLSDQYPTIVALDGETSNSTYSEDLRKVHPERYFEMFIAEQNMVGTALGLARRGKHPFASTFGAFYTRAFDQIRMSAYAEGNITFVGSHAGVSIGEDGVSQMALEDISMFRSAFGSTVLYPSDAISTEKLVEEVAKRGGFTFIRTTRSATPILYDVSESFPIGGSKVLKKSASDVATVIGAGITLHEALKAYEELKKQGVLIRVIDLYSIKPIDTETLKIAAAETKNIIVVEDHYEAGGIAEAVRSALSDIHPNIISLSVRKLPKSGKPQELLDYEEISTGAIVKRVQSLIHK
jgi:transketolase